MIKLEVWVNDKWVVDSFIIYDTYIDELNRTWYFCTNGTRYVRARSGVQVLHISEIDDELLTAIENAE